MTVRVEVSISTQSSESKVGVLGLGELGFSHISFPRYFSKNFLASAGFSRSWPFSGFQHIRILKGAHPLAAALGVHAVHTAKLEETPSPQNIFCFYTNPLVPWVSDK